MIYQGKEIDDRYGILSPFFEWADGLIEINQKLFGLRDDIEALGEINALKAAKTNLKRIVLQAERDADGNMASRIEAGE